MLPGSTSPLRSLGPACTSASAERDPLSELEAVAPVGEHGDVGGGARLALAADQQQWYGDPRRAEAAAAGQVLLAGERPANTSSAPRRAGPGAGRSASVRRRGQYDSGHLFFLLLRKEVLIVEGFLKPNSKINIRYFILFFLVKLIINFRSYVCYDTFITNYRLCY